METPARGVKGVAYKNTCKGRLTVYILTAFGVEMEGGYAEVVGWVRKILDPQCPAEERAICHQVSSSSR